MFLDVKCTQPSGSTCLPGCQLFPIPAHAAPQCVLQQDPFPLYHVYQSKLFCWCFCVWGAGAMQPNMAPAYSSVYVQVAVRKEECSMCMLTQVLQ